MTNKDLLEKVTKLETSISSVIKGKPEAIKIALVALISGGHLLIEDVPGVGKTTLAHALAKSTNLSFKRIQFTSDLLPSDILGVSVLDRDTNEFTFKKGPIFANIVLADEINRATPKTQSALLEAMNESRATIDGNVYNLPRPFIVIATQNPFEYKGTFPLPENQLDRFSLRISIGYPDRRSEKEILANSMPGNSWDKIEPTISAEDVITLQEMAVGVRVDEAILDYILEIINQTRNPNLFELGVSPRGAIALKNTAQALALVGGRQYCIPDDVKQMVLPVLAHRVLLKGGVMMRSGGQEDALSEVLDTVEVPV